MDKLLEHLLNWIWIRVCFTAGVIELISCAVEVWVVRHYANWCPAGCGRSTAEQWRTNARKANALDGTLDSGITGRIGTSYLPVDRHGRFKRLLVGIANQTNTMSTCAVAGGTYRRCVWRTNTECDVVYLITSTTWTRYIENGDCCRLSFERKRWFERYGLRVFLRAEEKGLRTGSHGVDCGVVMEWNIIYQLFQEILTSLGLICGLWELVVQVTNYNKLIKIVGF